MLAVDLYGWTLEAKVRLRTREAYASPLILAFDSGESSELSTRVASGTVALRVPLKKSRSVESAEK